MRWAGFLCGPKIFVNGAGFHVQCRYGAEYFNLAFTAGKDFPAWQQQVFWRIPDDSVKIDFAQGINHPPNLTPVDCAGAHGARFGTRIKSTARKLFGRKLSGSQPNEVCFRVAGGIAPRYNAIFRLQDNPVMLIDQHSPKRIEHGAAPDGNSAALHCRQ